MPPMTATALITTSAAPYLAWVRSSSMPPIRAKALKRGGTTQSPDLDAPDITATAVVEVQPLLTREPAGGKLAAATAGVGCSGPSTDLGTSAVCPGRSWVTGSSSARV